MKQHGVLPRQVRLQVQLGDMVLLVSRIAIVDMTLGSGITTSRR